MSQNGRITYLISHFNETALYYIWNQVCFNLTFGKMCPNARDCCVLWHEAIAGRRGCDVASAVLFFLVKQQAAFRHFRIWCDNCAPQNKNWILFSALLSLVNSAQGPDSVTLRYLEKGHTFMKADSIHGAIGRRLRREKEVLEFSQLCSVISTSLKSGLVLQMDASDFLPLMSIKDKKLASYPKLRSIKEVQSQKGSKFLFFKLNLEAVAHFKRPLANGAVPQLPPSNCVYRGINIEKKEKITKSLLPLMPLCSRAFWNNLHVADVNDLCSCIDTKADWVRSLLSSWFIL